MQIYVTKRDGTLQEFNPEKLNKVVEWACRNLDKVSPSDILMNARIQLYDKIPAYDMHNLLIKSAANLISERSPNYQYVAARLINYKLRKEVYGGITPRHILDIVKENCKAGYYHQEILDLFSKREWDKINSWIDHDRDYNIVYAGMRQFVDKYLIKNKHSKVYYETPQIAFMMIAVTSFSMEKKNRLDHIKNFYDMTSQFYCSNSTPVSVGVRSPLKQYSSCVLLQVEDNMDSLEAGYTAISRYSSRRAGIGLSLNALRGLGSPVKNGTITHTGVVPFVKIIEAITKCVAQGSGRNGATNLFYLGWHIDFEDLVVLKNNEGTEEVRARHVDHSFLLNGLIYERIINDEYITLFCPNDVRDLYDAFFSNQEKFRELYIKYENDDSIRKKRIKGMDYFQKLMKERVETGRIYIANIDNINEQGSLKQEIAPIKQSNLCMEITNHNKPLGSNDSEISLCTLIGVNWGKIDSPKDFEKPCYYAVRFLDNLLSYQEYPLEEAQRSTLNYRYLGIGITNFAYFLAKRGLRYNREALKTIHEYAEAWSYYIIKASIDLAKERGACLKSSDTKYHEGIFPIDTAKSLEAINGDFPYLMDWDSLREDAKKYGIRNATLMALFPAENSALVSNSTNGIEPIRSYVVHKQGGNIAQVAPDIETIADNYDMLWEMDSTGYLEVMAVLQKFVDQAISVNVSKNPNNYENKKIPITELLEEVYDFYKLGGKTLYYHNTLKDDDTVKNIDTIEEEECESCKL